MFAALLSPLVAGIVAVSGGHYNAQHTVRPGDTLSAIAAQDMGTSKAWPKLWWVNRKKVSDPNMIAVGLKLRIPDTRTWRYQRKAALEAIPQPRRIRYAGVVAASDPPQAAAAPVAGPAVAASGFEACVISRESGGNPAAVNPSSGAGGLFQFLPSTWASLGFAASYPGGAQTAPPSVQVAAFWKLFNEAGTSPWAPSDGCLWRMLSAL
jgi:hypothetical protein